MQQVRRQRHTGWWFVVTVCSSIFVIMMSVAGAQEQKELAPPSGDPSFIASGAKLELLVNGADHGIVFTEGAAVGCDHLPSKK